MAGKDCQLGEIHGWSAYERAYFMQAKWQGPARAWFKRLDDYNLEWNEWRLALAKAFQRQHDYASLLKEMLARKKVGNELIAHYYYPKLGLIERCRIVGAQTVSCLIDGLPQGIRENARAFGGKTVPGPRTMHYPEVLEAGPSGVHARPSAVRARLGTPTSIRCYNCQQFGDHLRRDCPKPKAKLCWLSSEAALVRLIDSPNAYKKAAVAQNGVKIKVSIDTGSKRNILTRGSVESLGELKISDTHQVLRAFGRGVGMTMGETKIPITIDDVSIEVNALIAECDLSGADLLLAQESHGPAEGLLHPIETVAISFYSLHIDYICLFPKSTRRNQYVLMVVDAFINFTLAKVTGTLRSNEVIEKLREAFGDFVYPRRIISDRGLAFTSKAFTSFLVEKGVKHVLNAIATPMANGQVERPC
ncbi:hypothetical protein HUJ05_006711 [Dendroctonus ponderosae]|nr:hypothetical protein HUJ05_009607 [Dendroctonus ponderosae]KAH1002037.1 hypothetical protein HUJ05_009608 [Dendroctonus ponderosae]KAH1019046.1 hypothetical protein HUJ05_006711 [Dendroctonus ponderosae]